MAKITVATVLCGLIARSALAVPQGQPGVAVNSTPIGSGNISGTTQNVDPNKYKVVIFAQTNQYYVQPLTDEPFTDIQADGSWSNWTHPWTYLVVLVVDPAIYSPPNEDPINPATDPTSNTGVIAWTMYPGPSTLMFDGYQWVIKASGTQSGSQAAPGPNFWFNGPSVVAVEDGYLRLSNAQVDGNWESAEVYLNQSLGYGTYTVQVASPLDHLDVNTVAAPLFIYKNFLNAEFDNEYSGLGGLIPPPNTMQFVIQPYNAPGNLMRYIQPATSQFTTQIQWRADEVRFRTWNGWAANPADSDIIQDWIYYGLGSSGSYNFIPGQEQVHMNLWLNNGSAPSNSVGDTMLIKSFNFQPAVYAPLKADPPSVILSGDYNAYASTEQLINISSPQGAVDFTVSADQPWLVAQTLLSVTPSQVDTFAFAYKLAPGVHTANIILASGSNVTSVPVTVTITVKESGTPCDVLNNGTINAAGVQQVINEALGLQKPVHDLNHDGVVNLTDAQIVLSDALGHGCSVS